MAVVTNPGDYKADERASMISALMEDIVADQTTAITMTWVAPVDGVLLPDGVYFGGAGTAGTNARTIRLRYGTTNWFADTAIADIGAATPFSQLITGLSAVAIAAGTVVNTVVTTGATTSWDEPSVSFMFRATPN